MSGITRAVDENGSSCGTTPLRIQTVGFYVVYLGGKMKLRRNFIFFSFSRDEALREILILV